MASTCLLCRGMREILDAYTANRFRRTDRAYISGWTVACAAYDQLLAQLAEQRGVRLPQGLLPDVWHAEERRSNEVAISRSGASVRLPAADSPPLPKPAQWRRHRLEAQVVATGTLLSNVAAGCLDEDVLAIYQRLAEYEQPDRTTARLVVEWQPVAFVLDEDVDQTDFTVTTWRRGDTRICSGLLRPGWTGLGWDLINGGCSYTLGRPTDRGFDREW